MLTDAALPSQLIPETDERFLAPYRIDGAVPIKALLRELIAKRAFIAIYSGDDLEDFVISQIVAYDDQVVELDFVTDEARQQSVGAAGQVIVIGLLETVKVQFALDGTQLVHGASGPLIRASLPACVYRIQRRDAFRVRPRTADSFSVVVRQPQGGERAYRIIDFSATGLAFAIPPGEALPREGSVHPFSRVESPGMAPIPCELIIRHVSAGLRSENGAHRIGCEFHRMDSEASRALQMVVIDLERRYRHDRVRH
ncbi:MAG: flagellar brake protein [Burkholderiaceae bacterium]